MAWPLLAMGALGAVQGLAKNRGEANERGNVHSAAEDQRKRAQKDFELRDLPELHGAEKRKTMGDLMARGMWGNFGRDPATGQARSAEMQAIMDDPWVYRSAEKLKGLSPHMGALPKPKGGGFLGAVGDVLGGAASGVGSYYGAGGTYGLGGGGGSKIASGAGSFASKAMMSPQLAKNPFAAPTPPTYRINWEGV